MIFYFSATGNSKYLAQKLQDITGDEMYDIAAELRGNCGYTLADDEIVYIVSPVYFFGMPLNVKEFIDRMSFNRRPDVDIMINFGTLPGDAIHAFEKELNAKGFNVRNRYGTRMPENYIILFRPPKDDRMVHLLDDADRMMEEVSGTIRSGCVKDVGIKKNILMNIFGHIARPIYVYGRRTRGFHINTACSGCGKCVDLCPEGIIEMQDDAPVWTEKKCLRCCSCINRCPHKAIEFGFLTKGRRRYHNLRI